MSQFTKRLHDLDDELQHPPLAARILLIVALVSIVALVFN